MPLSGPKRLRTKRSQKSNLGRYAEADALFAARPSRLVNTRLFCGAFATIAQCTS